MQKGENVWTEKKILKDFLERENFFFIFLHLPKIFLRLSGIICIFSLSSFQINTRIFLQIVGVVNSKFFYKMYISFRSNFY